MKALAIIIDRKVERIREVYGVDRASTVDEITTRLPALPIKLGDEWPAVRSGRPEIVRTVEGVRFRVVPEE